MANGIHITIVGESEISREGLRRILTDRGFTVDCVDSGALASLHARETEQRPHLLIVDSVFEEDGLRICARVREACPDARLVLMCEDCRPETVRRAFSAGADGFLVKRVSCEPLVGMLELIALGEKVVPSQLVERLMDPEWAPASTNWEDYKDGSNLSDREIGILRCLINGDPNKVISRRLNIAEATVKVHVKAILRKLHVLNRTQAAIWAVHHGLHQEQAGSQRLPMENGRATPQWLGRYGAGDMQRPHLISALR